MTVDCNIVFRNMSEAVLIADAEGYITDANNAIAALTGYTIEELTGSHLSVLYDNDSIKTGYELGQASSYRHFSSAGWKYGKEKRFWAMISISSIYEEGAFICYSINLRDITAQMQQELALRKSEAQYRLMIENVKDYAIFMLDTTGHILTWNEGARAIKGYLPDEIIGKHFSTFYTAPDLEDGKPARELRIAIETGKYEEEGWRVKKDGSLFWASVMITALFDEQNRHVGFSKVTHDLTGRKESEEALKESEERHRLMIENVKDYAIFMLDHKGRIMSWNAGAHRIKGYTADEIIGKYFSIFYPEEDIISGKPARELKIAIAEGKYEEEGWRLRKDGTRFWANVVITAVFNSKGALIGFSKVTRDLSERKQAEKELRETYDRYRRLANELKIANDELSYANGELEQFTSIVSHDLQEPIRTIKSFLQLIDLKIEAQQYDELKTYIGKSIRAANRMRELISNLLQYAQLSKGDLALRPVKVNDLVAQAVQNLRGAIDATGASITLNSEVEYVSGDRILLVQLIQNLLSNALKFCASQPQINILVSEHEGNVRFSITDNGIGIAEADLGKIFEIFRRLDTEGQYPGTGIGLAICKKITDRHNGQIWPESAPGKGTTFHFTIKQTQQATNA